MTGASGIVTGLRIDGRELSPLQGGEPGLSIGTDGVALLEPGAPTPGDSLVQGVPPTVGRMLDVRHAVAVDAEGYLLVAEGDSGMEGLVSGVRAAGGERLMLLIPPTGEPGEQTYWLTVRPSGSRAWKRLFTDVEPVPPPVWREVFRQRGRLLDHGD